MAYNGQPLSVEGLRVNRTPLFCYTVKATPTTVSASGSVISTGLLVTLARLVPVLWGSMPQSTEASLASVLSP